MQNLSLEVQESEEMIEHKQFNLSKVKGSWTGSEKS